MFAEALEKNIDVLLQQMLTPIRRAHATPLQFEIDSAGIASAALADFLPETAESFPSRPEDWESVTAALDAFVARTLADETFPDPAEKTALSNDNEGENEEPASGIAPGNIHPVAAWLDRFFEVMRRVDHRSFEILGLRIEGMQDRDVAGQLDLGLRLVKRIEHDMRTGWAAATMKE